MADPLSLTGTWAFSRVIDDRLTGTRSTVTGRTELVAENEHRVRWHETGTLVTGGQELPVYRTLLIVIQDGSWVVTFEDGRYFHPWAPGEQVEHPCGADLYVGHVEVGHAGPDSVDGWTVRWDVSGPAKDYTMTTVLSPP